MVEFALENKESSLEFVKCHAQEMETEVVDAHINLYVNEFSVSLGEEGRSSVLESISSQILSKNILLSFLKPTNSFVGTDLNNYGPFKIEDVGLIPFQNAILLIKQGIAKEIYTPI